MVGMSAYQHSRGTNLDRVREPWLRHQVVVELDREASHWFPGLLISRAADFPGWERIGFVGTRKEKRQKAEHATEG